MITRWGRELDPAHPLPEHPRPQLVREGWLNLNGRWEHAFTRDSHRPSSYDGPIVVPFSPETELSGVGRQLQPDEWLFYRRTFQPPPVPPGGRLLLHFGAVDQSCTVWVGGIEVGGHVGGYLPFTLDVTDAVRPGDNELVVRVRDVSESGTHARGKQRLDRGTIWYTAQSGIWQTVWLEPVPASYVERLDVVPHRATGEVEVTVVGGGRAASEASSTHGGRAASEASGQSRPRPPHAEVTIGGNTTRVPVGQPTRVPVPDPHPWTPEDPHLHDVTVTLGEDRVASYVGLREVGVGTDERGHRRLLLNGAPYPHVGVLDQGYWPDGLLTPPSDAAMVHDIERAKTLGFTMLRKHAKVEPLRWYHHCDRLGMLVWQDVVNGGGGYRALTTTRPARHVTPVPDWLHRLFGRSDRAGREEFLREVDATVALLRNTSSVVVWTPFNEGWGQFSANAVARAVRRLDPRRLVNHVSGWVDQGGGDIRSFHCYLEPFSMPRWHRGLLGLQRRVVALTEYGGHSLRIEGHDWSEREFGYLHLDDAEALTRAFLELHAPLVRAARDGLSATVWTQLTDVEDELNGLLTWDREVLKPDPDVVRRVTTDLRAAMLSRP